MSRWSAFEGIGALMHGELPSARDLSYSGIFWFLGTAAEGRASAIDKQKVKQKMDQIFIDTGIKPSQVITDSIKDRIIADQVASIDRKIPAAYETKKNIPEKLDMTLEQKVTDLREQLKIVQEKKLPQRVEKYTDADGNDVTRTIIDQKSAEKKTKEITKLADQIKDRSADKLIKLIKDQLNSLHNKLIPRSGQLEKLNQNNNISERVNILTQLGKSIRKESSEKAYDYFEKALALSEQVGDLSEQAKILLELGKLAYEIKPDDPIAISIYDKAFDRAKQVGDIRGQQIALYKKADILRNQNQSAEAELIKKQAKMLDVNKT